jgi:ABC-type transporter Mla subunit MlaD
MAGVQLQLDAGEVLDQFKQMNEYLKQMAEKSKDVGEAAEETAKKQESMASKLKNAAGSLIGNYNNIKGMLTDIAEVFNESLKRQQRWNLLLESGVYKKYKDQIDGLLDATGGLVDLYQEMEGAQKLFGSGVDLTGDKLTKLSQIAANYAQRMGVDVAEAMTKFSEAVAEGTTAKLEDMGIFMNQDVVMLNYATSIGVAVDELDELTKKQVILDEILKQNADKTKESGNNLVNEIRTRNAEAKRYWDQFLAQVVETSTDLASEAFVAISDYGTYYGENLANVIDWYFKGGSERAEAAAAERIANIGKVELQGVQNLASSVLAIMSGASSKAADIFAKNVNLMITQTQIGVQGLINFKGIVANNIDAINKLSDQYHKKAMEWAAAQQKITQNAIKRMEQEYENKMKKQQESVKAEEKARERKGSMDAEDIFAAESQKTAAIRQEEEDYKYREKLGQEFNKGRLFKMEMTEEELRKMSNKAFQEKIAAEIEYYDAAERTAQMAFESTANFTTMLINDVLLGEKEFRKEMIGDFVKGIGTQMVADGTFHAMSGIAKGWAGNKAGWLEAKAGGAEILAGAAFQGGGALIGTSGTGGGSSSSESSSKPTASMDRVSAKDSKMKTDVFLYPDEKQWLRTFNKSSKKLGGV